MDIFFLQLVILFLPGVIWERIDNRFGVNRPSSQFDILRRAFCFGITSYIFTTAITLIILYFIPHSADAVHLKMAHFSKDSFTLDYYDLTFVFLTSVAAFFLSIAWLYITNNKIPVRFMQFIGATRRFGDEDVWDFTFNSRGATVEYVHVRDLQNELNWSGWVELFSETEKTRELVLRDVEVTNIAGEFQYITPRVYLARPIDSITIEFPYRELGKEGGIDEAQRAVEREGPETSAGRLRPGDDAPVD